MKRIKLTTFTLSIMLLISAVGNAQSKTAATSENNKSTSVLGNLWSKIAGSSLPLINKDLVGKWEFQGTACSFETENLLKKAGGAVVASQVESKFDDYCTKAGIRKGTANFTFNADNTYSAHLGLAKLSGKYQVNDSTQLVTMTYLFGMGKLSAVAHKSGSNMQLLFDADSMLKLMKVISKFTDSTSVVVLGKVADMYDGMLLGFDLDLDKI